MSVQVCVRCGSRWPVAGVPGQWCPGCRGVLMSPIQPGVEVPPARRNFRWVARRPDASRRRSPARLPSDGRTPRYRQVPRWGLLDAPAADTAAVPSRRERLAELAPTLLSATFVLFALGAVAELVRYGLLLYNRTTLISCAV